MSVMFSQKESELHERQAQERARLKKHQDELDKEKRARGKAERSLASISTSPARTNSLAMDKLIAADKELCMAAGVLFEPGRCERVLHSKLEEVWPPLHPQSQHLVRVHDANSKIGFSIRRPCLGQILTEGWTLLEG